MTAKTALNPMLTKDLTQLGSFRNTAYEKFPDKLEPRANMMHTEAELARELARPAQSLFRRGYSFGTAERGSSMRSEAHHWQVRLG
jgi:hypothetical protein